MQFTADLKTLNSSEPFNSTASGSAIITHEAPSENIRTVNVKVDASGLEDLTAIGGVHVAHIHGQFLGNADKPLLEQGDGAFFEGEGGIAVDSTLPTVEDSDVDGDGFINFIEGRPNYGPVVLDLTSEQIEAAPDGTPPMSHFLQQAEAGEIDPAKLFPSGTEFNLDTTYTFDLTDPDQLRQYNNLMPLNDREIVLHGLTIPLETSEAIDATVMGTAPAGTDLGNGEAFRITAPVAAGEIKPIVPDIALDSKFVALTDDNTLVSFDPANPADTDSVAVTGVDGALLGIDTRPADGLIYGITTANNIYTIDADSGAATYVSTLNMPFEGGTISGFDFNPVADRLRLVGDNDQNFRINVDTGEVTVDGTLAFAEGDTNNGVNPNVTAAAYTNSFDGTDSTELYNIDTLLNDLVLQNPPNDGTLVTAGDLGIDFDTLGGFDILSSPDGENAAFAVSDSTLYTVDLDTGMAFSLGEIGSDNANLQGLTIVSDNSIDDNAENSGLLIDLTGMNDSTVNFTVDRNAGFENTVGFYEVDPQGNVTDPVSGNTINLGDEGYTAAAIANRSDISLTGVNQASSEFTAELAGGKLYAPFLVVDGTIEQLEDGDSSNDPVVHFPFLGANSDNTEHIRSLGDNILGFEDSSNSGDLNYSDLVVKYDFV
ncbi:MAG TPA: DUF4394 domain-containing protein [Coleofasciculaceae cyanobacterium]|jgi:hypothetical protein